MLITIDGGTTNTRLCLRSEGTVTASVSVNRGARFGLQNREQFLSELAAALQELLRKGGCSADEIPAVIASGMITSEGGLYELPHIPAPAGREELHRAMKRMEFPALAPIPFYLIPGVRACGTGYRDTDVMRGEETELIGIQDALDFHGTGTFLLPGSHAKRIETDENGRIVSFCTALTGEMLAAIVSSTILSASVTFEGSTLNDYLYEGYDACEELGVNGALFKVRILDRFLGHPHDDGYSFLVGVVLHDEIRQLTKAHTPVIVGGQSSLREATRLLTERYTDRQVLCVPESIAASAASRGMEAVYLGNR